MINEKLISPIKFYFIRYEELTAEERLLSNEVQGLSDRIEIWSTQRPGQQRSESVPPVGSARKFDSSNSNLIPEIIEYDVSDSIISLTLNHCLFLAFSTRRGWTHRKLGRL